MSALDVDRFTTFLVVVLDPTSHLVTIVNAGHMSPVVRGHVPGEISEQGEEEAGFPIAIDTGMDYESVQFLWIRVTK